ncbi:hypothetical protein EDD18DRAFT_1147762 [Armillaria luteobubalina]|uniref:Cysteine-rich transmembrane CYSTM domain-containing protein n=2 Tax=Armillaria TaxID=47424 RepID=A0AA39QDY2_9AGAR|nr:hypothetical protein IW262DRAFT_1368811 [Armillaria fumosa]KAK0499939.1 hypothetical protein EDD18DRAFT_1147762 [Armillaria luteobubalina]
MSYYPPQGAPGQGGYYPQQPPQSYQGYDQGQYQGGYMPQQQPQTIIVQQQPQKSDDSNCCMACLAGMCCFCCAESLCD